MLSWVLLAFVFDVDAAFDVDTPFDRFDAAFDVFDAAGGVTAALLVVTCPDVLADLQNYQSHLRIIHLKT